MDPLYGQRTTHPKGTPSPEWILVDAENQILGRLASQLAKRLMGKHKPDYHPSVAHGDSIVVINASKVKVSGDKTNKKVYRTHSGYMGGLKERLFSKQMEMDSRKVILHAVKGMLPKNNLSRKLMTRIRVFQDDKHNLESQKPQKIEL